MRFTDDFDDIFYRSTCTKPRTCIYKDEDVEPGTTTIHTPLSERGPSTGLVDMNGDLIYEGDIITLEGEQ